MADEDHIGRAANLAGRMVESPAGKLGAGGFIGAVLLYIAYALSAMQGDVRNILLDGEKRQAAIMANKAAIDRMENRIDAATDAARDVGTRLTAHEKAAAERLDVWNSSFERWSERQPRRSR